MAAVLIQIRWRSHSRRLRYLFMRQMLSSWVIERLIQVVGEGLPIHSIEHWLRYLNVRAIVGATDEDVERLNHNYGITRWALGVLGLVLVPVPAFQPLWDVVHGFAQVEIPVIWEDALAHEPATIFHAHDWAPMVPFSGWKAGSWLG